MNAAALKSTTKDVGAIPFRFEFELTAESTPVERAMAPPPTLPVDP